ncbi:hypothetical protein Rleg2_5604 (plasmid) [Rhizobium leguminosarum bv. trifolii WSM2304]|uniref:Uncharacterized protein n=1 Tax=Rhizobium leguminosarum bv. trifolii (strain WSM2304) TaxID=395492 RepID=A0ABF7QXI0_RHILW|nr:hypothetical protein [Rhizobium leguminosarum]ACI58780.1 hypothetical protein Rleg2_5604 [Rhizobium leguminosarum bv. trifolii WSM2304]
MLPSSLSAETGMPALALKALVVAAHLDRPPGTGAAGEFNAWRETVGCKAVTLADNP